MGKLRYLLFSLLIAILLMVIPTPASAATEALVTETQLFNQMSNPDTVILDISSATVYNQGHIPGAINITSSDIIDPASSVPSEILLPAQLEALLSRIGVKSGNDIYIYGEMPIQATRLWWTLHYYGIDDVKLLNGNLQTWKNLGYPVTAQVIAPQPSTYKLNSMKFRTNSNMTTAQVNALLGAKSRIIDSRSADEFSGKTLGSGADRRGRIPQSINIYWKDHLDANGRFKSADDLKSLYARYGVTASETRPVIVYCHSGFQSTVNYFALTQILGFNTVANYDSSWLGWSKDPVLKVECDFSRFTIGSLEYDQRSIPTTMDIAPYIKEGRTYLPVRYLAMAIGVTESNISWDDATQTVTLVKGSTTVKLIMGSKTLLVNDTEKTIDTFPEKLDPPGRVMLPARAIVEAFGGQIDWDEANRQVLIFVKDYVACGG